MNIAGYIDNVTSKQVLQHISYPYYTHNTFYDVGWRIKQWIGYKILSFLFHYGVGLLLDLFYFGVTSWGKNLLAKTQIGNAQIRQGYTQFKCLIWYWLLAVLHYPFIQSIKFIKAEV